MSSTSSSTPGTFSNVSTASSIFYITVLAICFIIGVAITIYYFYKLYLPKRTLFNLSIVFSFLFYDISVALYFLMPFFRTETDVTRATPTELLRYYQYPIIPVLAVLFQNLSTGVSSYQALYLTNIILKSSNYQGPSFFRNCNYINALNNILVGYVVLQYSWYCVVAFAPEPNYVFKVGILDLITLATYFTITVAILGASINDFMYISKIKSELLRIRQGSKDKSGMDLGSTGQLSVYENKARTTSYGIIAFFMSMLWFGISSVIFRYWPFTCLPAAAWLMMLCSGFFVRTRLVQIVNANPMDTISKIQTGFLADFPVPATVKKSELN